MIKRITLLLLLLIVGCSKLIDEPSLIEKDGVMYLPQSDKPYSGDVSKLDNFGKTLLKGAHKNGKKDGLWTWWYENGEKKNEGTFKDGKENRLHRWWYENGQKSKEGTYKDGKQVELVTSWYENGQKGKEGTFKDGELVSENCWDIDGNDIDCD